MSKPNVSELVNQLLKSANLPETSDQDKEIMDLCYHGALNEAFERTKITAKRAEGLFPADMAAEQCFMDGVRAYQSYLNTAKSDNEAE